MPYLIGTRIILREYRWDDLPHIREWVNDYEITNNLHDVFLFPNTLYETERFLKMMIEGASGSKGFIISDKDTQSYIGQIDLHQIDYRNRNATLGIVIGKKNYLGKGYGQEAIELLESITREVRYVGRTVNPAQRKAAHNRPGSKTQGLLFELVDEKGFSYETARGVEQMEMDRHRPTEEEIRSGKRKPLLNAINGISLRNKNRNLYLQKAREYYMSLKLRNR